MSDEQEVQEPTVEAQEATEKVVDEVEAEVPTEPTEVEQPAE